ncbi:hypothetical protein WN48_07482 [Eufriesea mexicana]|uniref:Uncharacterized protein n=1 Tax=Eufriesea mexicana TaxID=516756 RepID=A0A310SNF3_9HYME|nr:hypothetical protein WN48_07482 [Eufriesea mexicana]
MGAHVTFDLSAISSETWCRSSWVGSVSGSSSDQCLRLTIELVSMTARLCSLLTNEIRGRGSSVLKIRTWAFEEYIALCSSTSQVTKDVGLEEFVG